MKKIKNAQKMPDASVVLFEKLFRKHDVIMLLLDAETAQIIDANDAALIFYGYSLNQITAMKIGEINEMTPDMFDKEFKKALREEQNRFTRTHRLANGQAMTVEVHTTLISFEDRKCLFSIVTDITEHAKTQEREQLLINILDLLNRAEMTTDLINGILAMIKTHTRIEAIGLRLQDGKDYPYYQTDGFPGHFVEKERYLCSKDESGNFICDQAGNPLLECMCGKIIQGHTDPGKAFFTQGGSFWTNSTTRLLDKTTESDRQASTRNRCNGEGYESVALIPLRASDTIIGLLQLNDRRKDRFTLDMIKYFEGLGAAIAIAVFRKHAAQERLRFLEESQQNQKLEALGVLAGGISHDFNNMLAQIFGYIELAHKKSGEVKIKEYLEKTLASMDRAKALTGQLMTFAKGGNPIKKIQHLFPFVQDTTLFALSGTNVKAYFDVEPSLWPCDFDQNQIGQVVDNIIINSQQAMPAGGTIEISAKKITLAENEVAALGKGDYVRISIKDKGNGIPSDILPRIFEPFFTTKTKGHGLGLAICHSIVKRHGGHIYAESEHGKGTAFQIYLPAFVGALDPLTGERLKDHSGHGTFLVMDDEPGVLEIIKEMLESFGYSVICKDEGKKAVDFFIEETRIGRTIAGMLFDLTVPGGMGGKQAIAEIRKWDRAVPVFVASGYSEDPVMANPHEYGFNASICKPFGMDKLASMLNIHIMSMGGGGGKISRNLSVY